MTPSQAVRAILQWAALGLAVIVAAAVVAFWVQQGQVREIRRLAGQNRVLIQQVDTLNRRQADQAYTGCVALRERAKTSQAGFARLVEAHRRDGDRYATAIWQSYLDQIKKTPLAPCEKPEAP